MKSEESDGVSKSNGVLCVVIFTVDVTLMCSNRSWPAMENRLESAESVEVMDTVKKEKVDC